MGYCHTPAQVGSHGAVCGARNGAAGPAARGARLALGARALLAALRLYQGYVSPLLPSACKFYPTCSHYAAEAIARRGARRGAWLALKRLLRCRPFSPGGYDPVPDAPEGAE